jgi:hypothetical protein
MTEREREREREAAGRGREVRKSNRGHETRMRCLGQS